MTAYEVRIDWDEDGARIVLSTDEGTQTFKLYDPEQCYDAVKGGIWPWLYERDEAKREYDQYVHSNTGPAAVYFAEKRVDWPEIGEAAMDLADTFSIAADRLDAIDLQRKREKGE